MPKWKPNPYHIVSYRVFTKIDKPQSSQTQEIDAGEAEAPRVVSEPKPVDTTPKQDETVSISVTVVPPKEAKDLFADPYVLVGEPYVQEEVEPWYKLLIKDIIELLKAIWTK